MATAAAKKAPERAKETLDSVLQKKYEEAGVGVKPMRFLLKGNRKHLMMRPKKTVAIKVFDGKNDTTVRVPLRYSEAYDNPVVEVQNKLNLGDSVQLGDINFYGGEIIASDGDPCLQKYLVLSPQNVANGGTDFVLHDPIKEEKQRAVDNRTRNKAIRLVDDASEELLDLVGTILTMDFSGQFKTQDKDTKYNRLSDIATSSPEEVIEAFGDKDNKIIYAIFEAKASGTIEFKNGDIVWGMGSQRGDVIMTYGVEEPVVSLLAFLKTTPGSKVKQIIMDGL